MAAPTSVPSQPTISVTVGDSLLPGPDFRISYGVRTSGGTIQGTMTDLGRLGSKIKTNILMEKYGRIRGGSGRCALEGMFPTADLEPFVEASMISGKLKDLMILSGRATSEVTQIDASPTVTPYDDMVGLSRTTTGELSGWQIMIDIPGPYGNPRRIVFFNAYFEMTGDMSFDMSQDQPTEIAFKVTAGTDRGSKAGGNDPIGYIFDPNSLRTAQ